MPTASITYDAEMVTALCVLNGYVATINGVADPETASQFAKRQLVEWAKAQVYAYRLQSALAAAEAGVSTTVNIS